MVKGLLAMLADLLSLRPEQGPANGRSGDGVDAKPLLDVVVRRLNGKQEENLAQAYRGKVILIVNTASQCGFTPQYAGLDKLYATYKDRGLVVLGFPSNDFANQEPGTENEIQAFCRLSYGVKFPMFAKTRVLKRNADPLYRRLGQAAGKYPRWNFHKYLISRQGQLVASYSSFTRPLSKKLIRRIESLL